jgi:hypothetical protein
MNQLTRSLIIFLSLILTQARASHVEELTSQASLLTQFAIAGDAGYQNQQALNQWNRQLHRDEIAFLQELANDKQTKAWLEAQVGKAISDEELTRFLFLGALYGVDRAWQEQILVKYPNNEALFSQIYHYLLESSNHNKIQFGDRINEQNFFTSDIDQYRNSFYGIHDLYQNQEAFYQYSATLDYLKLNDVKVDSLSMTEGVAVGVGKGVWGTIKGVAGVVTLPWDLGKAYGNKYGELMAIVVYDGVGQAYLQVIDDIGNIPTQLQSTGAQFAMMKQIFEQQGNIEEWNRLMGETGGEYLGNMIPLGAIKHVGKIVPIAKGAVQTSRNLAVAGRLALAEAKLLKNADDLLRIPYAEVRGVAVLGGALRG